MFPAALGATALLPAAKGDATLTKTMSGWRIELDASGLPRLDSGRFYQAWLPRESRTSLLVALGAVLQQGELADLAVEELRKGEMWDLTEAVLAQYGRKGLDAPIQRRAIVRYALSCPLPQAKTFVVELRKREAELVHEVEEWLQPGQR